MIWVYWIVGILLSGFVIVKTLLWHCDTQPMLCMNPNCVSESCEQADRWGPAWCFPDHARSEHRQLCGSFTRKCHGHVTFDLNTVGRTLRRSDYFSHAEGRWKRGHSSHDLDMAKYVRTLTPKQRPPKPSDDQLAELKAALAVVEQWRNEVTEVGGQ